MKACDIKIPETVGQLIQNRPYNMVFDGKDFVVLPSGNRKERRSYKYVSQPSCGLKQIDRNEKIVSLYDKYGNKHF
jgi:hypothetical protein